MNTNTTADYLQVDLVQTAPIPLNVRFSCQQHELIVLVGPSGSGKTTILRSIAGLYHPQVCRVICANQIWSNNKQKIHQPAQLRRTGLVFQHYALFPHLSVLRNIALACDHVPDKQRHEYALEILHLVNMDGLEQRYPSQLSGGQQQRVALARALARQPSILLLDEPFSAVDQVTRRKLRRELARLRQKLNIPIILVTHDLDEARMLADRMYILHNGTLLQDGTPTEILSKPANAQVARLVDLGNLFSGVIIRHDLKNNLTYLGWGGLQLECSLRNEYQPGTVVDWVIPPESIVLHRRDRPSRGERENPVHGIIEQSIPLGENTSIVMKLDEEQILGFSIPTHTARRNNLGEGENITVSLLAAAIHIMPGENVLP